MGKNVSGSALPSVERLKMDMLEYGAKSAYLFTSKIQIHVVLVEIHRNSSENTK